jgi:hypothetical protein
MSLICFCGECDRGCWITCQPRNSRGHCRREIEDARALVEEYEPWLRNMTPGKLRKVFGRRVNPVDVLTELVIEHFGPDMLLEEIW